MKLTQLIAEYLYSHKQLSLQGIGTFILDSSLIPLPDEKQDAKEIIPGTISFTKDITTQSEASLVEFISSQTGKMKALASSDLESYLEQARQFINIGKPFLFEGIGTLAKNKDGGYEFTQGNSFIEKIKSRKIIDVVEGEEETLDYKSIFLKDPKKINWRRPVMALVMLIGLAIVVGGGYWLYKKTSAKETTMDSETFLADSGIQPLKQPDTLLIQPDTTSLLQNQYISTSVSNDSIKFVLDNFQAARAFARYEQLKNNGWAIRMETKDSLSYKLFVKFPVPANDTLRVLDSLRALNGRSVYIEHQN